MIAFACKQCGKRYERPDEASGALVFCECGAGTRVPYESTLPPTAQPYDRPAPAPVPAPAPASRWGGTLPQEPLPRFQAPTRDRAFCLNHPEAPTEQTCTDCKETFCAACVVALQGMTLCGPCKNFRLYQLQRPPSVSIMAVLSPIIAIAAGGFWVLALAMAAGANSNPSSVVFLGSCGLIPQFIALLLGAMALRHVESGSRMSGRALAITGIVVSVISAVVIGQIVVRFVV